MFFFSGKSDLILYRALPIVAIPLEYHLGFKFLLLLRGWGGGEGGPIAGGTVRSAYLFNAVFPLRASLFDSAQSRAISATSHT